MKKFVKVLKKIIITAVIVLFILLLFALCEEKASSSDITSYDTDTTSYETDTMSYETTDLDYMDGLELPSIQSVFFGVSFGTPHNTVSEQLSEAGFDGIDDEKENKSLFFSDEKISFGGTNWLCFETCYANGDFEQIKFIKEFENEEDARHLYNSLSSKLKYKYGEVEEVTPESKDLLALSEIKCKDGWINLSVEKNKYRGGAIGTLLDFSTFVVGLRYSMDETNELINSDL